MKLIVAALAAILALGAAGSSLAQQTLRSTQARPLYKPSPIVLAEVVGMDSHSVTVRTGRLEKMVFEFDSKTVMPISMSAGTGVKVEFHLLNNGMRRAARITPLEAGSLDARALQRQLALAEQERDAARAENATNAEGVNGADGTSAIAEGNAYGGDAGASGAGDELPRTASPQTLLLVLGAAATGLGLGLGLALRRKGA